MPIKLNVSGTLEGPIRETHGTYWFEVSAKASKSAPKGLPAPSDALVTVICNGKQLSPCRALIEQGDKILVQGELALDVPASSVGGDLAVVAYQLSTVTLEEQKKAAPPAESEPGVQLPDLKHGEPVLFPLAAIIVPPELLSSRLNPEKLTAARQELAAGVMPGPIEVAMLHGSPVLQDGYRKWVVLTEAGHNQHPVMLTDKVKWNMNAEQVASALAARPKAAPPPDGVPKAVAPERVNPAPKTPLPPAPPKGAFTCAKCPQKVAPKLAVLSEGKWCCPDCGSGKVNPVTRRDVRFLDRGFPASAGAVREFCKLTGLTYADPDHAALHVRLGVLLGMLMRYNQDGESRGYLNQGLVFSVRQGQVDSVAATPQYGNVFKSLREMLEVARKIDEKDLGR